jgi:hypothetical protein
MNPGMRYTTWSRYFTAACLLVNEPWYAVYHVVQIFYSGMPISEWILVYAVYHVGSRYFTTACLFHKCLAGFCAKRSVPGMLCVIQERHCTCSLLFALTLINSSTGQRFDQSNTDKLMLHYEAYFMPTLWQCSSTFGSKMGLKT